MRAYIDKECRGSIHVAGATCCVTCLQNAKNELRSWGGTSPQGQMIARYLTKINARRHPENAIRRQAEIEALDELVKVHRREYEAAVDRIIGQRQWREMKTKSGPL